MRRILAVAALISSAACIDRVARDRAIDYMSLYYAVENQDSNLVNALLERGAPVDAPDIDSAGTLSAQAVDFDSPLQVAAKSGNVELVRVLLKHHPWVDHRCCDSPAALGYAAERGYVAIVRILLDAGADPTIKSNYGAETRIEETPLDAARRKGHTEVVRVLEEAMK